MGKNDKELNGIFETFDDILNFNQKIDVKKINIIDEDFLFDDDIVSLLEVSNSEFKFNSNIMLKVKNYKNKKTFVKEIEIPQKFYNMYYAFQFILNDDGFKQLFNKKEKEFFKFLRNPDKEVEENVVAEANLNLLILFGNSSLNVGIEIVGDEFNFVNNEEYIVLGDINQIADLWKKNVMEIINSTKIGE